MEKSKIDSQYDSSFDNYAPKDITTVQVKNWKYLCGLRIMGGLMWVFFVSGLMKLRLENLYLNNNILQINQK